MSGQLSFDLLISNGWNDARLIWGPWQARKMVQLGDYRSERAANQKGDHENTVEHGCDRRGAAFSESEFQRYQIREEDTRDSQFMMMEGMTG